MTDLLALCVALIIIGALILGASRSQKRRSSSNELYHKLLSKCAGDRAQVERLIEGERKRNPKVSHDKLIKNAIERLDHDRR